MHDEADFLAAIRADPDDDTPRLVFADWLEENGQAARAEYVRTAVELDRVGAKDPRRDKLATRQRELFGGTTTVPHSPGSLVLVERLNCLLWAPAPDLAIPPSRVSFEFARGLVETVRCLPNEWLVHHRRVVPRAVIRHVYFLETVAEWWGEGHEFLRIPAGWVAVDNDLIAPAAVAQEVFNRAIRDRWPGVTFHGCGPSEDDADEEYT